MTPPSSSPLATPPASIGQNGANGQPSANGNGHRSAPRDGHGIKPPPGLTEAELRARFPGYRTAIVDTVLAGMAQGDTVEAICRRNRPRWHLSPGAFRYWVVCDVAGLAAAYARARLAQCEAWADRIVELADTPNDAVVTTEDTRPVKLERGAEDPDQMITTKSVRTGDNVQRSALQVDTLKWLMARLHPSRYGDTIPLVPATLPGGAGSAVLIGVNIFRDTPAANADHPSVTHGQANGTIAISGTNGNGTSH